MPNQYCLALVLALFTGTIANAHTCGREPIVQLDNHVSYQGYHKDRVEAFHGIKYAKDTSGQNRFEPPKPYTPSPGSVVLANGPGPACPQDLGTGEDFLPLYLTIPTNKSEDCLSLNVNRPNGTAQDDNLPVMVFIHGTFRLLLEINELLI